MSKYNQKVFNNILYYLNNDIHYQNPKCIKRDLAKIKMTYYSELAATTLNEEDIKLLNFPSKFLNSESRLMTSLNIILEVIDSQGRTLKYESDARLLCLAIKEIERFCNLNQTFVHNNLEQKYTQSYFKTSVVFNLLHKILITNNIAISLSSLWCNTTFWLYSHLIHELCFLDPINIIKQQFERNTPPMALRHFGVLKMKSCESASNFMNELVSKLETRNDLKYAFETIFSFVINYIPNFNLDKTNADAEGKIIRREQVKMFTNTFFCALDLAIVTEDSFMKTASLDSICAFYKVLTQEEKTVLLNIAETVRESSIILNEEVDQLIKTIEEKTLD